MATVNKSKNQKYWKQWIAKPKNKKRREKYIEKFNRLHPTYMRDYMRNVRAKQKAIKYAQSLKNIKENVLKETN